MDAIEALSIVTDICSDKTGTITVGKMVVKKAWLPTSTAYLDDDTPATIDLVSGQAYTVESGSELSRLSTLFPHQTV
jgi:P-type Na+/K+ transporter